MAEYDIKIPAEASTREIFFDRNSNKLSYKDNNGIITILDKDITIPVGFAFKNIVSEFGTNIVGGSSVTAIRSVLIPANTLQNSVLDFGISFAGQYFKYFNRCNQDSWGRFYCNSICYYLHEKRFIFYKYRYFFI